LRQSGSAASAPGARRRDGAFVLPSAVQVRSSSDPVPRASCLAVPARGGLVEERGFGWRLQPQGRASREVGQPERGRGGRLQGPKASVNRRSRRMGRQALEDRPRTPEAGGGRKPPPLPHLSLPRISLTAKGASAHAVEYRSRHPVILPEEDGRQAKPSRRMRVPPERSAFILLPS